MPFGDCSAVLKIKTGLTHSFTDVSQFVLLIVFSQSSESCRCFSFCSDRNFLKISTAEADALPDPHSDGGCGPDHCKRSGHPSIRGLPSSFSVNLQHSFWIKHPPVSSGSTLKTRLDLQNQTLLSGSEFQSLFFSETNPTPPTPGCVVDVIPP